MSLRKLVSLIFTFCTIFCMAQYPSQNISLLGHWDDENAQMRDSNETQYSSVYGYYDAIAQKEYAIVGGSSGTYFIEVTDPGSPIVRDFVPGRRDSCVWREYKTYGKYVYMVSDDLAPNSLQIVDLSYLPDSVHVVYDDNVLFERAHTIYIDGNKLYCGITTNTDSTFNTMSVYSLSNPESPALLRKLDDDYPYPDIEPIHDMYVRNDTVYASAGYQGLFILKLNSNNTFSQLASLLFYPGKGYNHSSALTPDGKTLIFADEDPANLPVKTMDVSDFNNLTVLSTFKSNEGATAHNPYTYENDKVVIAYYQDGIQIFDISDPSNPTKTGYFDTRPENGDNNNYPQPTYQGCWGAYPYLPSGNLLALDMQNGLFILDATAAYVNSAGISDNDPSKNIFVYPNPVKEQLEITLQVKNSNSYTFKILDITGKIQKEEKRKLPAGVSNVSIHLKTIVPGNYILRIEGEEFKVEEKITKVN